MTDKEALKILKELQDLYGVNEEDYDAALSHLTKMAEKNERFRPVLDERKRQDKKWGVQNHGPMTWLAILSEEVGEASKAVLEGNAEGYQKELTQVAAVAVAMLECFKRGDASLVSVTEIQRENAALKAEVERLRVEHDLTVKHMASDYNKLVDDLGKAEAWAKKLSDSHNGLEAKWRKNGAIIIEQMVENDRLRKMIPIANVQLSGDAEYWKARAEKAEAEVKDESKRRAAIAESLQAHQDELDALKQDVCSALGAFENEGPRLAAMRVKAELDETRGWYQQVLDRLGNLLILANAIPGESVESAIGRTKAELDAARPLLEAAERANMRAVDMQLAEGTIGANAILRACAEFKSEKEQPR